MKAKNIPSQISAFLGDPSLRSMLIDGPWGCGKTYQIRDYIEKNKKNKVYYVSLFGFETVDEINTDLFYKVNKKKWFLKRGLMTVSKAIPAIPYVSYSGDAISYALGLWRDNVKGKAVVIFDDFERVGEKLYYEDILGYFSHLFLSGVRVICVCDSTKLDKDKKEKFNDFREKVFDKLVTINEKNSEIIINYFSDLEIKSLQDCLYAFDDNLRNAERTARLYRQAYSYCEKNQLKIWEKFSQKELLLFCVNTIKVVFDNLSLTDSKSYGGYDEPAGRFGGEYALRLNAIDPLTNDEDSSAKQKKIRTYCALLSIEINGDYELINSIFSYSSAKKGRISVFLLSDKNKISASKTFLDEANSGAIRLCGDDLRFLVDILRYTDIAIDDKTRKVLVENMLRNYSEDQYGPSADQGLIFTMFSTNDGFSEKRIEEIGKWKNDIQTLYYKNRLQEVKEKLISSKKTGDYSTADHYLRMLTVSLLNKDDSAKDFLIKNDFLLPDLSGDITDSEWGYSHSMAELARQCGLQNEMLECMKNISANDPDNKSLEDRLKALARYKLNLPW